MINWLIRWFLDKFRERKQYKLLKKEGYVQYRTNAWIRSKDKVEYVIEYINNSDEWRLSVRNVKRRCYKYVVFKRDLGDLIRISND